MITFVTTPKPFSGHIDVIQRNAIKSWKVSVPDCEVLIIGDEPGVSQAALDLGVRVHPHVSRSPSGAKYLADLLAAGQRVADRAFVCYINCDIVLGPDFLTAMRTASSWRDHFLMVGQRWDLDVTDPIDFSDPEWWPILRRLAITNNRQRPPEWIDYFLFRKGLYDQVPPLVVGRNGWDNWMLWYARRKRRVALIDASKQVIAIHQNHDYAYHPGGRREVQEGVEAQINLEIAGGWSRSYGISDATHSLDRGIRRKISLARIRREAEMCRRMLIDVSRPLRRQIRKPLNR